MNCDSCICKPTLAEIKMKKLDCVVHTPTRDSAGIVARVMPSCFGDSVNILESHWDIFKEDTCYFILEGTIYASEKLSYFKDNPYEYPLIYEYSDLVATDNFVNFYDSIADKDQNYKIYTNRIFQGAVDALAEYLNKPSGKKSLNKLKEELKKPKNASM